MQHVLLPAIVLAGIHAAAWTRYLRASTVESLRQRFVAGARARGVTEWQVLEQHVLRTALLPRALLSRAGRPIEIRIGTPIAASRLKDLAGDGAAIAYLRDRTEILEAARAPVQPRRTPEAAEPVVAPVPVDVLAREIAALPEESRLVEADGLDVYVARPEAMCHSSRAGAPSPTPQCSTLISGRAASPAK